LTPSPYRQESSPGGKGKACPHGWSELVTSTGIKQGLLTPNSALFPPKDVALFF